MNRPVLVSSRRKPNVPIRRMALPKPHVVDRGANFMDLFAAALIVAGFAAAALLMAALLLGALWLLLWVARQVVGLLA